MTASIQYWPRGHTASEIAESVESGIRQGRLIGGDLLPPVRTLAARLTVAPGTVATAYRVLRQRGYVVGERRRGTRVAPAMVPPPLVADVPDGVVDLARGNPDPRLLPDLGATIRGLAVGDRLYGEPGVLPELVDAARRRFAVDGIDGSSLAVVGGALDGVERALQAHLRVGDRVAVEDPGYTGLFDLLAALHLQAVPVAVDERGLDPDALAAVVPDVAAVVLTPRAHNPTGAALDPSRARELRRVLRRHEHVLVVEDDHAGPVAGVDRVSVGVGLHRWAAVHSVSKSLGPDLRLALVAGDATTIARIEARQRVGTGWVSTVLQQMVVTLWRDRATAKLLDRAARTYATRRDAVIGALADHAITAVGASGLNVWVPVAREQPVVEGLRARGWAVAAGERFRLATGPAIRVTAAALEPTDARRLAADLGAVLGAGTRTRPA